MADDNLKFGELGPTALHLCIDMQRIFAENSQWQTPWLPRILPQVCEIAERHAINTVFTRFITPHSPEETHGSWRRYYQKWSQMTLQKIDPEMMDLVPELKQYTPPASILDKRVYSPWFNTRLHSFLQQKGIDTVVITGGETDICVMAAISGAVDFGYRTVLVTDALCSSCDKTHDATIDIYKERYSQQVETVTTENLLRHWPKNT